MEQTYSQTTPTPTIDPQIRRLYRSPRERQLAGVCGGLGEFFRIDPTLIRLATVVATIFGGAGAVFYVVAWIIVPLDPRPLRFTRPGEPEGEVRT